MLGTGLMQETQVSKTHVTCPHEVKETRTRQGSHARSQPEAGTETPQCWTPGWGACHEEQHTMSHVVRSKDPASARVEIEIKGSPVHQLMPRPLDLATTPTPLQPRPPLPRPCTRRLHTQLRPEPGVAPPPGLHAPPTPFVPPSPLQPGPQVALPPDVTASPRADPPHTPRPRRPHPRQSSSPARTGC